MRKKHLKPAPSRWTVPVAWFLSICNVAAAVFGIVMLRWGMSMVGEPGEQWGFLGILILSAIALAIMLLILLPGTIILILRARKRLGWVFCTFLLGALLVGMLTTLAADRCSWVHDDIREEQYRSERVVYTSGMYDAVLAGDVAKVESLLGEHPEAIYDHLYSGSLLSWAVKGDDQAMVTLLLKHGAKVDDGWDGSDRPIHIAAQRGNIAIAQILLQHGADVNIEGQEHDTPMVYAQKAGHSDMVRFLKSKGASTENAMDVASRAIDEGETKELRRLLDDGLDPNSAWASATLLHSAAGNNRLDAVTLLLDRGAKIDAMKYIGTPLHDAAYAGNAKIAAYLISRGANPNIVESRNYSPLYRAAQHGHLETVRTLLDHGADPNLGASALKEAKRQEHDGVVELLEKRGAKE
jgi:ankyrin repeat protein